MFCLKMPPVFSDYQKIFIFESRKIGEESIKLIGYIKVVKTSKFVQGLGIGLNFFQVARCYR